MQHSAVGWPEPARLPGPRPTLCANEAEIPDDGFTGRYAKVLAMEISVRRDRQLVSRFTGIRSEGVWSLQWEDIDEGELLHVRKAKATNRTRCRSCAPCEHPRPTAQGERRHVH